MKRLIAIITAAVTALAFFTACATDVSDAPDSTSSEVSSAEIEVANAEQYADNSAPDEDSLNPDSAEEGAQSADEQGRYAQSNQSSTASGSAKGASSGTKNNGASGSASSKADTSSTNSSSKTDSSSSKTSSSAPSSSSKPSSSSTAPSSKPSSVGTIGSFTMTDLAGNTANQSILNKYDLTMINVWATYCNPCITEIPEIDEVYKEFKSKGVNIIGVAMDGPGNVSSIQSIVNKTGASYKMYIPSSSMLNNSFMSNVTFVPTTFFVDRNGDLVGSAVSGSRTASAWRKILNERLAQAG